ncbi:uncharacterized protein LOC133668477 isoform X3 [Populus nigra]|uniref:uncharacterized protein LOC133668477 isoform X3 n=1 Tax=Populus nigra TaxID=3691 RepID=UPI002B269B32|nr:uncharacterized protein LOC133668477 isoform X3 [Populus nigra]
MSLSLPLPSRSSQIRTLAITAASRKHKFLHIPVQQWTPSRPLQHLYTNHQYFLSRTSFQCMSRSQQQEYEVERLFSNLNQVTLKREPGSLSSAILLVAGTTIGAGILAIPAVTQESGFLASSVACIFCWIFMVTTGLLIAEVNVNTMCELGSGGVSLVSMAKRTLGVAGVQFSCWSYIFIHYALLIAYVARSSDILTNFLGIPLWESATLFSLVFGGICYFGRTAIVLGTAIPLGLFLVWDGVILGSISTPEMADKIADPLQQLLSTNGVVGPIIQAFSFLAIGTSYIGFVLGLSDFLADLLKLPAGENKPLPYILTLIPPLVLALLDPEIFFKALDFAGTYGVLVLFGIIPAAMAWSDRYSSSSTTIKLPQLVPGGKVTLSLVMGAAGCIILSEILENFMNL